LWLIVAMTREYPINRFTNPNLVYKSWYTWQYRKEINFINSQRVIFHPEFGLCFLIKHFMIQLIPISMKKKTFVYNTKRETTCHHCACCMTHFTHTCSRFTQCHEMGSRWFHCGWMEILELYILGNSTTHTHTYIHSTLHYIYIYYTSLHLSDYLPKSTSTDANRTVIWLYTLPIQTYNHESLGENYRFHSASPWMNFQNGIHLPF
jgi:hypothetical protein